MESHMRIVCGHITAANIQFFLISIFLKTTQRYFLRQHRLFFFKRQQRQQKQHVLQIWSPADFKRFLLPATWSFFFSCSLRFARSCWSCRFSACAATGYLLLATCSFSQSKLKKLSKLLATGYLIFLFLLLREISVSVNLYSPARPPASRNL